MPYPPKKNAAYTFGIGLRSASDGNRLQSSPTISAGDVKVSIDGGSYNNLTNLPAVTPPASKRVQISLIAAEMNGDRISILFSDQTSPPEWQDLLIEIDTSARYIDDLIYPTYQLADLAATDGVIPTVEQSLYMITQFLSERQVVGTTVTVKKPDGTTLMTFTLNDPTNPTSITRTA